MPSTAEEDDDGLLWCIPYGSSEISAVTVIGLKDVWGDRRIELEKIISEKLKTRFHLEG